MEIKFQSGGFSAWQGQVMLIPLPENVDILRNYPDFDKAFPWLAIAPAMRDVSPKKGDLSLVHGHPDLPVSRMLFMGLGEENEITLDRIRTSIAKAIHYCRKKNFSQILLPIKFFQNLPGGSLRLIEEAVYAAQISLYDAGLLKKTSKKDLHDPEWLAIAFDEDKPNEDLLAAVNRGQNAAQAVAIARRLENTPANLLTPHDLAQEAEKLAKETGLQCRILDENEMLEKGMGAILAVGQGSVHPPRLVILEHNPDGHSEEAPLIFVGKGLCFDSGGISLKPPANMHHMKGDMSGAAAVLSALYAIAKENVARRVIGILACAENMPGGAAIKPGDVVCGLSGDTIEITNTDAEGRLVLCDALSYAQKFYQPAAIIDIATLTGACIVALGDQLAGLFSDDDNLITRIKAAGQVCGEYFWPMPLWEKYIKKLKSEVADICHIGGREGGAITAALFLKHFVAKDIPWAHLDIAGEDWLEKKTALCPKGPTGFGCRTLLEIARGGVE
ncbi:MAG: leucyl aminopeptidase [Desulfovibrionaceae bacterium]|nr:leucyl aminopeptidase [Desulfovibrionaceae bacterium]